MLAFSKTTRLQPLPTCRLILGPKFALGAEHAEPFRGTEVSVYPALLKNTFVLSEGEWSYAVSQGSLDALLGF